MSLGTRATSERISRAGRPVLGIPFQLALAPQGYVVLVGSGDRYSYCGVQVHAITPPDRERSKRWIAAAALLQPFICVSTTSSARS
jgi:hypothetical protein